MEEAAIDEKYRNGTKLLLQIKAQLELLETGEDTSEALQNDLASDLNHMARITSSLETLAIQQSQSKRELWKIRVKQLVDTHRVARNSMESYLSKQYKKHKQELEHAQLFERRKSSTVNSTQMQKLAEEGESIDRSISTAFDLESLGHSILSSIGQQNEQIKNIQSKLREMANNLGLHRSIIKIIERRQIVDKILVYGGMIFTLILIWILWYYIR